MLRMRMICLIWPWLTLLLMQPNTTRARGCRDGLYWKANLQTERFHHSRRQREAAEVSVWRWSSYFWASSVHWSSHLQAGMSLMQA